MNPLYLHYASAIFQVAIEEDKGVCYNNDMALVNLCFRKHPEYLKFLDSELLDSEIRIASIDRVFGTEHVSPAIIGFLKILVRNKGIKHFGDIYKAFEGLFDKRLGILRGKVFSPFPMDTHTFVRLEKAFSRKYGKNVILEFVLDKHIIGGMRVQIEDHLFDYSIDTKIETIKERLLYGKDD